MRIYSWNVLFSNKQLDQGFEFIKTQPWDIFCLQEVTEEFLARLQTLRCEIAYRIDVERLFESKTERNYVVILSKHPIGARGEVTFPEYWSLLPFRTRLFVGTLGRLIGFSKTRNRGGVYADISLPGRSDPIRVFNLHLILAAPAWRLKEFETAMAERDPNRPAIVCGDFNTLESPHITPLNWLLGGTLSDAIFFRRERTHIQHRFVSHELTNTLPGSITHEISRSQLDHILVSHALSIENAEVCADSMGSDHYPIRADVA